MRHLARAAALASVLAGCGNGGTEPSTPAEVVSILGAAGILCAHRSESPADSGRIEAIGCTHNGKRWAVSWIDDPKLLLAAARFDDAHDPFAVGEHWLITSDDPELVADAAVILDGEYVFGPGER